MDKELLFSAYEKMYLIRNLEQACVDLYLKDKIFSMVHFYIGQEAVAVGVCENLTNDDYVFGNHRSHGHYLAKGGNPLGMVAEMLGKEDGCAGGAGGSMHMIDKSVGFRGSSPILGSAVPIGTGSALAQKMNNSNNITVSFFGDGASEEGIVYESINFAAVMKLPFLMVMENNLYSVMTPASDRRALDFDYRKVCEGLGALYEEANGNDFFDVYEKTKSLIQAMKEQQKPGFLQCMTFRHKAHSTPLDDDNKGHRTIDSKENREKEDSVLNLRNSLISKYSEQEVAKLEDDVKEKISLTMIAAQRSLEPNDYSLFVGVPKKV